MDRPAWLLRLRFLGSFSLLSTHHKLYKQGCCRFGRTRLLLLQFALIDQHMQNWIQSSVFLPRLFLGAFYPSSPPHLLCTHAHISMYVFAVVFLKGLTGLKYRMGFSSWECYLFSEIFPTFHWAALQVLFFASGFKYIRNTNKYCCNFILLIWNVPLIKWVQRITPHARLWPGTVREKLDWDTPLYVYY